jgi:hypothetical protein
MVYLLISLTYISSQLRKCLKSAGGLASGVVDYYQIHTYAYNGAWSTSGPFNGVS